MPPRNEVAIRVDHPGGHRFGPGLVGFAKRALASLGLRRCQLSICLATDGQIQDLNRRWRARDRPTDVLSFRSGPTPVAPSALRVLGDVVVSLDTAKAYVSERGVKRELERYLAHGMLHLLGYNHHRRQDAVKMAALERKLIGGEGLISARRAPRRQKHAANKKRC